MKEFLWGLMNRMRVRNSLDFSSPFLVIFLSQIKFLSNNDNTWLWIKCHTIDKMWQFLLQFFPINIPFLRQRLLFLDQYFPTQQRSCVLIYASSHLFLDSFLIQNVHKIFDFHFNISFFSSGHNQRKCLAWSGSWFPCWGKIFSA